ncbi:hypothetical protein VPH35_002556 [Triticum aestivum]
MHTGAAPHPHPAVHSCAADGITRTISPARPPPRPAPSPSSPRPAPVPKSATSSSPSTTSCTLLPHRRHQLLLLPGASHGAAAATALLPSPVNRVAKSPRHHERRR